MPLPYSGVEEYTFISYSHLDKDIVIPILEKLEGLSIRFWFDKGIEFGDDWASKIAKKIDESVCFLVFLSKNSLSDSSFVRREINFAVSSKKTILSVLVDDASPDGAIQLLIGIYQTIVLPKTKPGNELDSSPLNEFVKTLYTSLPDETKVKNDIPQEGEPYEYTLIIKREEYSYFLRDQSICNNDVDLISVLRFNRKNKEVHSFFTFTFGACIITQAFLHSIYVIGQPLAPSCRFRKPEILHFEMNVKPIFHGSNPPLGEGNFAFEIHKPFSDIDQLEMIAIEGVIHDNNQYTQYPAPNCVFRKNEDGVSL